MSTTQIPPLTAESSPPPAPPPAPRSTVRRAAGVVGEGVSYVWLVAAFLVAWQVLSATSSTGLVPGPLDSVQKTFTLAADGRLGQPVAQTMGRLVLGFGLGILTAVPIGLAVGTNRVLDRAASPILLGLQSIPTIAWLPFAVIWFGLSGQAVLFIVWLGTSVPLAVSTVGAVKQIPPLLARASTVFGARGLFRYRTFILPAVVPGTLGGLRLSWSFAWRSAMAAELLVRTPSLGGLLETQRNLNQYDGVAAVMLVIAALGIATEHLAFGPLERLVARRYGFAARA